MAGPFAHGQFTPYLEWEMCLGGNGFDVVHDVVAASDGGYFLAGYTMSNNTDVSGNHGDKDGWIVKLDAYSGIEWQRCVGGSSEEEMYGVAESLDGGCIAVGTATSQDGDVTGLHGNTIDGWAVKLGPGGGLQWQKTLGAFDVERMNDVLAKSDGTFLLAGFSGDPGGDVTISHGNSDAWLVHLSATGTILWQQSYGGSQTDEFVSLVLDGSDVVALARTGSNNYDVSGNHGGLDFWLVRIDPSGLIVWQECFGGSVPDEPREMQRAADGGFLMTGETLSSNGDVVGTHGGWEGWLVKTDAAGVLQWQRPVGGSAADEMIGMIPLSDGGVIGLGRTQSTNGDVTVAYGQSDAWAVGLDAQGVLNWQLSLGTVENDEWHCGAQQGAGWLWCGVTLNICNRAGLDDGDFWLRSYLPSSLASSYVAPKSSLALMPNPCDDVLRVQLDDAAPGGRIMIADMAGRRVMEAEANAKRVVMDMASLPGGLYLASVCDAQGRILGYARFDVVHP